MAALDFPASPTVGQQATLTNGFTYQWDGAVWTLAAATGQQAGGDLTGTYPNPSVGHVDWSKLTTGTIAAGGDLAGSTYPNPTVTAAAKSKWSVSGGYIIPADSTKTVATSGTGVTINGSSAEKWRIRDVGSSDFQLRYNQDSLTNLADNAASPSYAFRIGIADDMTLFRAPAGSPTAFTQLFQVKGSDGKTYCTLADGSVAKGMLGAGAAYRNYWVGAIPNSFNSNNVVNTFVTIASCAVTLSGGLVLLLGHYGLQYSGATGIAVYLAYFCDGAQLGISKWVPGATTGGILVYPLPCVSSLDAGRPAGAHTYYLKCYVVSSTTANITSASDQVGAFYVVELS